MPAPPKFGDAAGDIGIIEVFGKGEAENFPQADGHIAVTGKIEIDVQHIGRGVHPAVQHRGLGGSLIHRDKLIKHIGDEDLFTQAQHKALRACGDHGRGGAAFLKLGFDIGIADDGPRDELREHGDIGAEVDEIALGGHGAPVDIHHITEDLEGVEADANGQRHPQKRHRKAGHGIEAADEEIGVLAVAQKQQAEKDRGGQKEL